MISLDEQIDQVLKSIEIETGINRKDFSSNSRKPIFLEARKKATKLLIIDVQLSDKGIAKVLGVSAEAIKNFSEEAAINYFNSFYDQSASQGQFGPTYNFNPIDKVVELYERLVQSEKDKIAYLEQLLKEKK